jgi:D-alanyl-D-alanine carboxypeptidase
MNKNSLWKLFLYGFLSLSFLVYPGKSSLLKEAAKNPQAFVPHKSLYFQPQPIPQLKQPFKPELFTSSAYLVVDLSTLTPILSQNPHRKMFPASLVKLATALISYRTYGLNKILTVRKVVPDELRMGLVRAERLTSLNLLYGILVYSANDAAYTLAENYSGGVKSFVGAMNNLAQELNMTQTNFANPIGFDNPTQYSTAYDLALLSREFLNYPFLLNLTSTKTITVSDVAFEHFHYLTNINELLGEIPHLGGLKTGTTESAGQNLISYYRLNNRPILIVLLKSEDRFFDTRLLINYLKENLTYRKIT